MIEKFKSSIKKEIIYYIITLIVLTFVMHFDLLSNPLARLEEMQNRENYSHPFVYAFAVYAVIFIIRKIIDFFTAIFQKKPH